MLLTKPHDQLNEIPNAHLDGCKRPSEVQRIIFNPDIILAESVLKVSYQHENLFLYDTRGGDHDSLPRVS